MARYQCQDSDCHAVVDDDAKDGHLAPLLMRFRARTYLAGSLGTKDGKPYPESDVTDPARVVKKCPWCRGNLVELPQGNAD